MSSIRHPNVVLFMGLCFEPPCMVSEFCARGSLYDVLKRARAKPALGQQLDWPKRLNMALDAAKVGPVPSGSMSCCSLPLSVWTVAGSCFCHVPSQLAPGLCGHTAY